MSRIKALALLSGGLDSTLATKLILQQGIEVKALNFVTPFCLCGKGGCGAAEVAKELGIPIKIMIVGQEYLRILRKPKHGYGKNMNPCIDCRIFMLKKAKQQAKEMGASFIFTGEVLGERPMSQHVHALRLIEKEAGLEGKILRPLSAKLLKETEAEKKGLVSRERLLDINGRSRKRQFALAKHFMIANYPCPAGGCLLTCKEFASKLRDLFAHKTRVTLKDVSLLKVGRHFRHGKNKIVVGRNEGENQTLLRMKSRSDAYLEAQGCGSPIALLQGQEKSRSMMIAAGLTAYHSDQKSGQVLVKFSRGTHTSSICVSVPSREEVDKLRIG